MDSSVVAGGRGRILIADDDETIAQVLALAVRRHGLEAVVAADGQAALDVVRLGGPACFDVAVLDVVMPRLDGVAAMRALRALAPNVRCIVMTAFSNEWTRPRLLEAGADDVLAKPFQLARFFDALAQVLRAKA